MAELTISMRQLPLIAGPRRPGMPHVLRRSRSQGWP